MNVRYFSPDGIVEAVSRRLMAFQYVVWAFGILQILRLRRRTRRLVHSSDDYEHLKVAVTVRSGR